MYAVYNYKAGSTQAQVLSDIVAIATGTTNVSSLSASCVQANTSIISTVAAGWTVHDAAAGANAQVIRCLNNDGTTYKYAYVSLPSSTGVSITGPESWNASTHAATNNTTASTASWDMASGGYFYLYVTPRNFIMMSWTVSGYQPALGVLEYSRDLITATSYPCHAVLYGTLMTLFTVYLPRMKNVSSAGDSLNMAVSNGAIKAEMGNYSGSSSIYTASTVFRDSTEALNALVYKIGITNNTFHYGTYYEVLTSGFGLGNSLDEVTFSGTTYVIFKRTAQDACLLIPKA